MPSSHTNKEEILKICAQSKTGLQFLPNSETKMKKKTWCVLVLLLPLCYPFCSFGKNQKISSNIHENRKNRQNHQFIAIVDCVPKKVDLSLCLSLISLLDFYYTNLQG